MPARGVSIRLLGPGDSRNRRGDLIDRTVDVTLSDMEGKFKVTDCTRSPKFSHLYTLEFKKVGFTETHASPTVTNTNPGAFITTCNENEGVNCWHVKVVMEPEIRNK